MKPIKIINDERGNTLRVRFSDKKEAYCKESDVGKGIIYSIAERGRIQQETVVTDERIDKIAEDIE